MRRRPSHKRFTLRRHLISILVFVVSLMVIAIATLGAGVLDPPFGTSGRVITSIGGSDIAYALAIQADGKLIAAGSSDISAQGIQYSLVRYNTNGTLDSTFGTGGKVTTDFNNGSDSVAAVIIQPDGKIVAAGGGAGNSPNTCCSDFTLARYNTNGTLDTSFGNLGKVITDFAGTDSVSALVRQADGKIVAAGTSGDSDFALARYTTTGSLDSTFGTGGKVITHFNSFASLARAMVLQTDGKLVVAGSGTESTLGSVFRLARYNTNGTLDSSFGVAGVVVTGLPTSGPTALVLQPDGKLVAAGYEYSVDVGAENFALVRYNTNGSLDNSFGTAGKVTTDFGAREYVSALVLQTDGKLVAAGQRDNQRNASFALARYNSNGTLDSSFGIGGKVVTDFNDSGDEAANALIIQPDGKLVAAGSLGVSFSSDSDFALARYADTNPTQTTFHISGQALNLGGGVLNGVTIRLSGSASATRTTDFNGYYAFDGLARGGNYTLTAEKQILLRGQLQDVGFLQSPVTFNNLTQDVYAQDFRAFSPTVTISGTVKKNGVAVSGVTLQTCAQVAGGGGTNCVYVTSTTGVSGSYSLSNLPVFNSYDVEPQGSQFFLTPTSIPFTSLSNDVLGADFAAADVLTISGHLRNVNQRGLNNETVVLSGSSSASTQTDANGLYTFNVASGGSYDVAPSDSRVSTWNPSNSRHYENFSQSVSNADFEARFPSFTVSGVVKNNSGTNFPGVNVQITGTNLTTKNYVTNSSGSYTSDQLNVLGDYIFTPQTFTVSGVTYGSFNPANKAFASINTCNSVPGATCSGFDYLGIDFTATPVPTATTSAATAVTSTTATLNGSVNPNGVATSGSFEWGTSPTLATSSATATQTLGAGTTNLPITANLTGLVGGTTYYFRTVATSNAGTVKGSILNFTTTPSTFTISGHVTNISTGSGLSGASVALSGAATRNATTNSNGDYSFANLSPGSYTVTPSKPNFTFPVPFRTFDNLSSNQSADFTAGPKHRARAGVFRPTTGKIFLKYSNTSGIADTDLTYGDPGDYPLAGDWNGDGIDTVGIYRDGVFYLRNSNTTGPADVPPIRFGDPTDQPVVGDWNGDGVDTIGIYRNGTFYLSNSNTQGALVFTVTFGNPGDVAIAGDWDGDGIVTIGVFRPSNGLVYLRNSNTTGNSDLDFVFGNADDKPVAGDWNGDGIDTIGIYRNGTFFLSNS
ncbi:MAG TPA: carboxypeptidase regulatory-like domain-containing protein, partial [Pyrinomonadaceae bacterium]|nr:carboxypeptidase regulatory-like domain-containing protein [Pyrinomonadaceae bacterium]